MEKKRNHPKPLSTLGWLALGVAAGFTAFGALKRKRRADTDIFDVESVLKACERAADQLDRHLRDDSTVRAS